MWFLQIDGFAGGQLDEVRIYNRQLSNIEIALLADKSVAASDYELNQHFILNNSNQGSDLRNQFYIFRRQLQPTPHIMVMSEMSDPRKTYLLDRGVYDAPTEEMFPDMPESIMTFDANFTKNRLGLAQWITHPSNPLTARVMVNRIWQMFMGSGIVSTPEDFGSQGALPSHPELLDWLAVDFVESGWDIKALVKKDSHVLYLSTVFKFGSGKETIGS